MRITDTFTLTPARTHAPRGRLPAYARELATLPLPTWLGLLFVSDDFRIAAAWKGAPRIVIPPDLDPHTLDLRCAAGTVITYKTKTYGVHLMPTIEALALAGARDIVLIGPDGEWFDAFHDGKPFAIWSWV